MVAQRGFVAVIDAETMRILEAVPESDPSRPHPGRISGRIEANHLTFRYREDGSPVLEDVSVVAEPGEHGYAANRVVNLLHEVYLHLSAYYPEYLWDHYGAPQD